ncbi:hypothetical protein M407DRAFT_21123 [Tulasnella calospora MUT 4182]|uniref:Protein CPL1-like domain-containing protein n=1 Tax=Tulasnella calospora MUT 4182 TaxID=1051891 RepID=A0A0C3M7M8_9AGAM|nr:hypothetical protein M407DRAFT_21123 [Tulasnella calospora MUT 4182]
MIFRAPTLLVIALFTSLVLAERCNPGEYRDGNGRCRDCADGYISPNSSPNGQPPYSCQPCPAGQTSDDTHTQCQKCTPGNYNDTPGGTCRTCSSGYFNNVSGAKSCCQCCSGFYSSSQRTNCNKCPSSRPYSFPGSNENNDCVNQSNRKGQPEPVNSCNMVANNYCPNPTDGGPTGSPIARKKRDTHCTRGLESCPHYSGRGGFECVNTQNDPESCGGCVSFDGKGSGTDCTALEGVSVTRCAKGSCVVDACRKGYAKSLDGSSCTLAKSVDGSNSEALKSWNSGATSKRSSPAKRAIRGRVF